MLQALRVEPQPILIMPREQRILAIENKRTDASLDDLRVKLDAAVLEEPGEPV